MQPRIEIFKGKKFVGQRIKMSLTENKTAELWKGFMPRRNEIQDQTQVSDHLYSIQVYDSQYFTQFNLTNNFEKWAAKEVSYFSIIPKDMETFKLASRIKLKHAKIAAFSSTRRKGMKASDDPGLKAILQSGAKVGTIFGKSCAIQVERQLKVSPEENLEMIYESIKFLSENGQIAIHVCLIRLYS